MNFAELRFWGYLLLGLAAVVTFRAILRATRPAVLEKYDRLALAVLSMFLLFCVGWLTFLIWLTVAVFTYAGLYWILHSKSAGRRRYLLILIPLQLGPLLYYKYSNFLANSVFGLGWDSLRDLVIPVGLSFYTFQKVAFVIDTLAFKEPLPRFLDYINFVGFFPQIVAGPIERRRDLLPQMERFGLRWDADWINEGVPWIVLGLFFKMCLADNLAQWMAPFMKSSDNPFSIWLCNVLFGLRIYYDFAGYSLVAYGLGRCFGVRLTLNFLSPYCSTNFQEFWRRWHVTLSNWFRDYVYIPLGGSRVPWWAANVAIVFVVSGFWHGAGWNFILWGAMHGAFLIAYRLGGKWKLPGPIGWLGTMAGAFLAWLCFYETRWPTLLAKLRTLFVPSMYSTANLSATANVLNSGEQIVLGGLITMAALTLVMEWLSVRRDNEPFAILRKRPIAAVLVVLIILLAPGKNNAFIYFAF